MRKCNAGRRLSACREVLEKLGELIQEQRHTLHQGFPSCNKAEGSFNWATEKKDLATRFIQESLAAHLMLAMCSMQGFLLQNSLQGRGGHPCIRLKSARCTFSATEMLGSLQQLLLMILFYYPSNLAMGTRSHFPQREGHSPPVTVAVLCLLLSHQLFCLLRDLTPPFSVPCPWIRGLLQSMS